VDITLSEVEDEIARRRSSNGWGLTKEREADLETYIDRWQASAIAARPSIVKLTAPDDSSLQELRRHIRKLYELFELAPPKVVICQSPLQMFLLLSLLLPTGGRSDEAIDWSEKVIKRRAGNYLVDYFSDDEERKIYVAKFNEMVQTLHSSGFERAGNLLTDRLNKHYFDHVHKDLKQRVIECPATGSDYMSHLYYRTIRFTHPISVVLKSAFYDLYTVFSNVQLQANPVMMQSSMSSLVDFGFARERLGMFSDTMFEHLLDAWIEVFRRAPYFAFCENICIAGTYPVEIFFDEYLNLKDVDGYAMRFSDGYTARADQQPDSWG
jgi:hypothetical protein